MMTILMVRIGYVESKKSFGLNPQKSIESTKKLFLGARVQKINPKKTFAYTLFFNFFSTQIQTELEQVRILPQLFFVNGANNRAQDHSALRKCVIDDATEF
jgi:hypothetical protein